MVSSIVCNLDFPSGLFSGILIWINFCGHWDILLLDVRITDRQMYGGMQIGIYRFSRLILCSCTDKQTDESVCIVTREFLRVFVRILFWALSLEMTDSQTNRSACSRLFC